MRDKPVDKPIDTVDWTKPLQIKCGEKWYDVIFHKRYSNTISLIFEKYGDPVYIQENMDDLSIRDITIRNTPTKVTFERWLVYINNDLYEEFLDEGDAKGALNFKRQTSGKPGYIKHIKVEWEL